MFRSLLASALVILFGLFLSACEQSQDLEQRLSQAQSLTPKSSELNAIYQRSCVACHANSNTQAPLVGDSKAWQPRLDKGMETLLEHVVSGYAGMPPFGLCMDCSEAEFEQLILFMAQAQ